MPLGEERDRDQYFIYLTTRLMRRAGKRFYFVFFCDFLCLLPQSEVPSKASFIHDVIADASTNSPFYSPSFCLDAPCVVVTPLALVGCVVAI